MYSKCLFNTAAVWQAHLKVQSMTQSLVSTIDLRALPPPQRHALISSGFAALLPGQALELVNDHDPQPLNAQLQKLSPGLFSWDYLESGPQVWRVRISKNDQVAPVQPGSCCSGGACCG